MRYSREIETLIVFGTFGRRAVATQSLDSLISATKRWDVRIVVSDATPIKQFDHQLAKMDVHDYIWTPGDVSMASARNIAVRLAQDKYTYEWIMFVEDDLLYSENWYQELVSFGAMSHGTRSPLGLAYGVFSAAPRASKNDDTTEYDMNRDAYASLFGLRADQRLYKAAHFANIAINWDSDLLGISSCQTGTINHRSLMRGYCGGSIGHRNLCSPVEGETSTWVGERDIGPAAFDKRLQGYESIRAQAKKCYVDLSRAGDIPGNDLSSTNEVVKIPVAKDEITPIPPSTTKPMTATIPPGDKAAARIVRRLRKAIKGLITGRF